MRNIIYLFSILIFLVSCVDTKELVEKKQSIKTVELNTESISFNKSTNEILNDWLNYYKSKESTFSLDNFIFERTDTLNFIQGNVFGIFDDNFDRVYSNFIVFSPNKKRYIDFDSYQWSLDQNKELMFSPDQEINLVNIYNQTVKRIGFNGPSQWVENAFWKNDSIVILLQNSFEKYPLICEINLTNRQINLFMYKDSLTFKSNYSKQRFKRKGLKFE